MNSDMFGDIVIEYIIVAVLAYLIGSISSAILMGRLHGIDIRQHGSKNAGATNTLRTLGKSAAVLVLVGDLLKGVIAVLIGLAISDNLGALIGGIFSILGHNWPVYFGFKGGKGILTSLAVVYTIDWRIGLIATIIGLLTVALTRFVSLASIIGAAVLPVLFYFIESYREIPKGYGIVFSLIISILAIFRHRANISRLVSKSESKINFSK